MIKKIRYYAGIALLSAVLFSCKKDFLEITPTDQLSSESIFADQAGADVFLNDIYSHLPDEEGGGNNPAAYYVYDPFENYGDNAVSGYHWAMSWVLGTTKSYGPAVYNPGLYNHDYPAMPFMYDHTYQNIRKCNLFIEQVQKDSANFPEDWRVERLAEARFLRAFYYHFAWMAYGGLPIITKVLNRQEQGDSIFVPRSTFEETYQFMDNELAAAAKDLPNIQGGGRATKGAALALKGWIELFAHQYAEAAATNKEIMDLGTYSLFPDYNDQFLEANNNNNESIFAYQHIPNVRPNKRSLYYGPKGSYGGWGQSQPTQEFIDDYVMKNGLPITDPASGYDPDHPYENRELRFDESIIHDGSVFAGETFSMIDGSQYAYNPGAENNTGYFRRKGIDPALKGNFAQDASTYNFFRYAEVLLSFAEAKIELNQIDQDVIGAIDKVRVRGGLPTLMDTYHRALSQDEMRTIVRRERRVELAFENKRYWDLIRWKTAMTALNQPAYGIEITENNGKRTYTRVIAHTRQFLEKNYLFPLYQQWIDTNPKIKAQNGGPDGWVNGQNPGD